MAEDKAAFGKPGSARKNKVARAVLNETAPAAAAAAKSTSAIAAAPAKAAVEAAKPAAATKPAATKSAAAKPAAAVQPALPSQQPARESKPIAPPAPDAPAAKAAPARPAPSADVPPVQAAVPNPIQPTISPTVSAFTKGAKTMTETIDKSIDQTREATSQAAEQLRTAAAQTSEQSKAALERGARVAEEMADLTRGNIEALVASSKTAAKYVEALTQGAADYNRRSFEQASATLRSFAEVKSPTDMFRVQSDFARSAFDQLVAESARVSETMVKMTGDVVEPITSRYSVAAERLKAVAA